MRSLGRVLAFWMALAVAMPALAIDLSASPEALAKQKQAWVERIRDDRRAVVRAKTRHEHALAAYQRMKIRRRARGDKRARILENLAASEQSLKDAEAALETTYETARRAGVPPGWIRDAEKSAPAARDPAER